VAVAPAGFRDRTDPIATIGFIPSADDASAEDTARSLAARTDAIVFRDDSRTPDLLVVGSRPEAREGHVLISAAAEYAIETSGCPVIVTPRGKALTFARSEASTRTLQNN
jgi:hypothetical protein